MTSGTVVLGTGVAFSAPPFFAAVFARAGSSERGAASATASIALALDLGLGAGPIALGVVAGVLGLGWAFGAAAAVALVGCAWTVAVHRRTS